MCGICGQLRFDGKDVTSESLDNMMLKLAKRGPDSSGQWTAERIGFGHQRLSIICLLYTSPSPRDQRGSRMPSSA